MSEPFLGEIRMVGFNFAPRGWAYCNGQMMAIAQNTALFSLLGTIYGGNGQTTFGLPDLRSRVPMHWGQGPGLSNYVQGEVQGSETMTLNTNQIPAHVHTVSGSVTGVSASTKEGTERAPTAASMLAASGQRDLQFIPAADAGTPVTVTTNQTFSGNTQSAGGNQPFSILQPSLTVTFIIATEGIFPSRN